MSIYKTPLGYPYTENQWKELRRNLPISAARNEGREYYAKLMDACMIATKISDGLPPSSPEEAAAMDEARNLTLQSDCAIIPSPSNAIN
jgi:hypothetical protein